MKPNIDKGGTNPDVSPLHTKHKITIEIISTPDVSKETLLNTVKEHLDNFGWGMFWNKNFTKSHVSQIYVDGVLFQDLTKE